MSEYINNTNKRKEQIKGLLKQIHAGAKPESLKGEFENILRETNAAEITDIEQMLIEEGLPSEEIQNLCDVHVLLFKDTLDEASTPETMPGHPVRYYTLENQAIRSRLEALNTIIKNLENSPSADKLQVLKQLVQTITSFEKHYARKENILFPYLEKKGFGGPSTVMWGIHDKIRAGWKQTLQRLNESDNPADAISQTKEIITSFSEQMQDMIYKEEKILFPAAIERLTPAEWQAIAQQETEIGYSFIQPENAPVQVEIPETHNKADRIVEGQFPLDTGVLSLQQINMMIKALPVDITFVDENDEVRFFSLTKDRVFQRSPAIIGRKVQNCHPPQSVDKVQRILEDFKSGKRDEAEFWIQMGEKFVVISYYALRDEKGTYRGTVEVSLDAAHYRGLQGERRLLDD
ncbi:MAG: DUF438 domain-containing protein [Anaerolineaceae bacterium]|nr:DUF438 domain-containing protein [Anaerolineaceae bacterium]